MTEKLDRTTSIQNLTDPMGNVWQIVPGKLYPGLYEITIKEGNPQTLPPKNLRGYYTNTARALQELNVHLNQLWDKCEKPKPKNTTGTASAATS